MSDIESDETVEAIVKRLKIERAQLKSNLTKLTTFLDKYKADQLVQLQARLDKIKPALDEFERIERELEFYEEREVASASECSFADRFYEQMARAKTIIQGGTSDGIRGTTSSSESSVVTNNQNGVVERNSNVRFPALELPKFEGEYEKFGQFRDMFASLVHNDTSIDNIKKFVYLLGCLKGDAAKTLEAIEVTGDNYLIAWDILKRRYEDRSISVRNHINAILDLSHMSNEYSLRRLVDDAQKHVRSLKVLGESVEHWHSILIQIIVRKLDQRREFDWQEHVITKGGIGSVTFDDLIEFVSTKCKLMENVKRRSVPNAQRGEHNKPNFKYKGKHGNNVASVATSNPANSKLSCYFCKERHFIYNCNKLKALPVNERIAQIAKLNLCGNCLRVGHSANQCTYRGCIKCGEKHNSLCHMDNGTHMPTASEAGIGSLVSNHCTVQTQVLLSTALVLIESVNGNWEECRALIDSGSMPNFMTNQLAARLNLRRESNVMPIVGVGKTKSLVENRVHARIKSRVSDYCVNLSFFTLDKITENLPLRSFRKEQLALSRNLVLADPSFNRTGKIDILLGAATFFDILQSGKIRLGDNLPVMQATLFGWVMGGNAGANSEYGVNSVCNVALNLMSETDKAIERFWKIEECETRKNSIDEQECELSFINGHTRDDSGKFVVRLPLKNRLHDLGESLNAAESRLFSIERKFGKNLVFKQQYIEFMREYELLGHMSEIAPAELNVCEPVYYLPHHGVLKETSDTTKLRVVFDASCKTSSGVSLNDVLRVGPTVQDDLLSILIRFRCHKYAVTADIEKMYRQVIINKADRDLQRIVWREYPNDKIKHYKLNTVTYGTAAAPFLAIRSLQQIAFDNKYKYSKAAEVILRDFYVDDLLSGSATVEDAIELKRDVSGLLSKYGFNIRKWVSNNTMVGDRGEFDKGENYSITDDGDITNTLGLKWYPKSDLLKYKCDLGECNQFTKRNVLSLIARIFDPLGVLGPVIIIAKILMQCMWQRKLGWDDVLPGDLVIRWKEYARNISHIDSIRVPRHMIANEPVHLELHGFCDASQMAYGACIYVKSVSSNNCVGSHLICAKSRVAPLKVITLPRLELSGAVLLAQLYKKVKNAIKFPINKVHLWTDSTIVLAWLSAEPANWKLFVANRVTEIQKETEGAQWGHVSTKENPADILSRGVTSNELRECRLWWQGPEWLTLDHDNYPKNKQNLQVEAPEKRTKMLASMISIPPVDIFDKFSNLNRLIRVIALFFRFKGKKQLIEARGSIKPEEMDNALMSLARLSQKDSFSTDIKQVLAGNLHKKSRLRSLDPFLDSFGLLRVGGRLEKSGLPYDARHPIILHPRHQLTKLLILHEHHRHLHGGAQLLLNVIRSKFWIINGRSVIRKILHNCVTCFRINPRKFVCKMGDLPSERITPNKPFQTSGVDFAGPFFIKDGKLRNRAIVKAYLCIFVCFCTKAVHLEAVSDLSTVMFLNAFKRFVSRRGLPRLMFSDNGSNFVGASNELKNVHEVLSNATTESQFQSYLSENRIVWKFIPPHSPHQGGIWEAAVKRAKFHLDRVVSSRGFHMTFEQLSTIFAQVEAVLNSRPISSITQDPNDFEALTPGHFLIGRPLTFIPETDVTLCPVNRLDHYHLILQAVQLFWRRWSTDYLLEMQRRTKWQQDDGDSVVRIGSMVMLVDENSPPAHWKLGRVIECYVSGDKRIRTVKIKTPSGETTRAVQKICVLPVS